MMCKEAAKRNNVDNFVTYVYVHVVYGGVGGVGVSYRYVYVVGYSRIWNIHIVYHEKWGSIYIYILQLYTRILYIYTRTRI
jgi:hypothetical protein